jgi:hypothetical protein
MEQTECSETSEYKIQTRRVFLLTPPTNMEQTECSETSEYKVQTRRAFLFTPPTNMEQCVPKRPNITVRRRRMTQKKERIQNEETSMRFSRLDGRA